MSLIKSYLHTKMTETNDQIIDRDQLQEAYIESIIDGMDHKTMYEFVYDSLNGNLDDYTVDEVVGSKVIKNWGGKIKLIKCVKGKSTSNIIRKIKNVT